MSAFLGPIHVKMYDRVLYQDDMSQMVLELAKKNGWDDAIKEIDEKAPPAVRQPLEGIIDPGNIHGWLNEAVMRCERRFALIVCGILDGHPERMDALKLAMKGMGEACKLPAAMDAEEAYEALHDILLDGMPCDFPFVITESNADVVTWEIANCPHTPYWKEGACQAEAYYRLRDAWVEGALEDTGIVHSRPALYAHTLKRGQAHA